MADTGVKYPASVATAQETGDDNDWTTASNVGADDAAYAQITAASFDTGDVSYVLRATNFSMGVPAGATINGIVVEIERYYANGQVIDVDVSLTADGSTRVGDDKSTGANFLTNPAVATFGGSTDTWNAGLTVAQINASTFGVIYKMGASALNADGFLDFIRVTGYYTAVTSYSLDCSDGLKAGESLGTKAIFGMPITDGLKGGESLAPKAIMGMSILDGFKGGEILFPNAIFPMAISDGMKGGESLIPQIVFGMSITDGLKSGEGLSAQATLPVLISDGLNTGDALTLLSKLQMLLNDGVKLGEVVAIDPTSQTYAMLVADGILLGDSLLIQSILSMLISDGMILGDDVSFVVAGGTLKGGSRRFGNKQLERGIWKVRARHRR